MTHDGGQALGEELRHLQMSRCSTRHADELKAWRRKRERRSNNKRYEAESNTFYHNISLPKQVVREESNVYTYKLWRKK